MTSPLDRLVHALTKLPGLGQKSASRLAFHILRASVADARELATAIVEVKQEMRQCSKCCAPSLTELCIFCRDSRRDQGKICVVEEPADLNAVEKSGGFYGTYHVLHGRLSPLDGIGPDDLHIEELLRRLREGVVQEVIVATNPTVEGEATATYLAQIVKPMNIPVSRLASGIPLGAEVEYIDPRTLKIAIEDRRPL